MKLGETAKNLAVLVLLTLLSTGVARAAPPADLGVITCNSVAVPPIVRAEGIAELVGDIILTCTNVPPAVGGSPVSHLLTNVNVSLNVNVTNNLQAHPDAVLIINENNCTAPVTVGGSGIGVLASNPSCDTGATVPPAAAPDQRFQDPMFGELASATRIEWNGIHFPIPGGPSEPFPFVGNCIFGTVLRSGDIVSQCNPGVTVLRITSMRANASQLGVPAIEGVPFSQIQAFVSITGPNTIPISNNVLNVAIPLTGLLVDIDEGDAPSGLQCEENSEHIDFTISEGFATAFKTLGEPTFTPGNTQVESGYFAPDSLGGGGGASQSTRFLLRFFNIPEGVNVAVYAWLFCNDDTPEDLEDQVDNDANQLRIHALECDEVGDNCGEADIADSDDLGDLGFPSSMVDKVLVDIDGGFGSIVYEVEDDDPIQNEDCTIPLWFAWVLTRRTICRRRVPVSWR